MIDREQIRERFTAISPHLDERSRRLLAATEARAEGYGGIAAVSQATGVAPSTIARGLQDQHRLFSFISMNWRATPLVSYRVMIDLISATTTKTGLSVRCELDPAAYPKGIAVSDAEMEDLNIGRDSFHGEWNYTIRPQNMPDRAVIPGRGL